MTNQLCSIDLIECMNDNVSFIERCNHDWMNLLKELMGDKKTTEEKDYNRVAKGTKGFIEVMLNSSEIIA